MSFSYRIMSEVVEAELLLFYCLELRHTSSAAGLPIPKHSLKDCKDWIVRLDPAEFARIPLSMFREFSSVEVPLRLLNRILRSNHRNQ